MVSTHNNSNQCDFFSKTLIDIENEIYVEKWKISAEEVGIGSGWSVEKRRLYGGVSDGVEIITVNNGALSFVVVPTRGMSIWKGEYKGHLLGFNSPVRHLVHPSYVNLESRGGVGWLDGFNEWVVRCGLANFGPSGLDMIRDPLGNLREVTLTLHGKVADIPASMVKVKVSSTPPFEISVEGVVYESSMFGPNLKLTTKISTVPQSRFLTISDEVQNMRGTPDEMQILYHCNYGSPFLEEGSRFIILARCVVPRDLVAAKGIDEFSVFRAPEAGFAEQVYFIEPLADANGLASAMLVGKDESKAVSVSFFVKELPYITLWKNTGALEDGYVVGIEPGTSFPNHKRFEREMGRVVKLKPREKFTANVTLSVYLGKDEVNEATHNITKIQKQPKIYRNPVKGFSPL